MVHSLLTRLGLSPQAYIRVKDSRDGASLHFHDAVRIVSHGQQRRSRSQAR